MTRTSLQVSFPGSAGDDLAARLDLPEGEAVAVALFAHCFTCSKDIAAATRISRGLVAQGLGVLRFAFTGLGASGGECDQRQVLLQRRGPRACRGDAP